ncbi:copper-translocating P-type ATPase [Chitinophaga qingshengii]|uniref:Cadmium-translocating P-type ATPase n=1 Tax=Chitinophaga qingshengii TaxID=1569794 RepID=A0ABR7TVK6_9BACT|nr:copper-translocating P-type ATPase [Chitinophaga qingshengii]MBC9933446.1 cadmium-translocating P-type ATPase [Chitinophaga qingshengii]
MEKHQHMHMHMDHDHHDREPEYHGQGHTEHAEHTSHKEQPSHHEHQEHAGHGGHAGHDHQAMIRDFRQRFYVVLVLTIPVMLLSKMIQHWLGWQISFPGDNYVLCALSTVIFFYGGWPFLSGWWSEMKMRNPGMMTLIGFAITVAFIYSVATLFGLQGMDFFWELATLILIMLLGHWIEMKSVAGASRELELLVQLMPSEAHLVEGGNIREVKTDSLQPGNIVLIKPGEKVAADGTVTEGNSYLNESMLTGESKPVKKNIGDRVIAGSLNGNQALHIKVSHNAASSYLSQVIKLVNDAQQAKSGTQLLADKAARWLTLIAITAGIATFAYWRIDGQSISFAMERMVTVIVICCPHALGLAVPLVVARSTTVAAKNGLLIKNRTAFENARKVTTLVFDKTGTLTVGKFQVVTLESLDSRYNQQEILSLAAAVEQQSEHPIATGIVDKARSENIQIPAASDMQAMAGKGISATINGKTVQVVSPAYVKEQFPQQPAVTQQDTGTLSFVIVDGQPAGYIVLADEIRPESLPAIQALKKENIASVLLTGDNKKVAAAVAQQLQLDNYIAEVLPHQKLEEIKKLQAAGQYVAMTGDGINDAPALAQADIGIAIGSGSDIAAETAGIVLVNSNPQDIVSLIRFGKATYRKMVQNLAWATGYNVITMPLAAGVLYHWGVLLSPAAGAVLMTVSTVIVAINARLLKL